MKKSLMNYIYIHISRALILLLALFTAFSAVNAFKINADDTSTVTIIKKTNDNTNKDFKFRIKAYKTTENTSYEYKEVMSIYRVNVEDRWIDFWTKEEDFAYEGYTFLRNSFYRPSYNGMNYNSYMAFVNNLIENGGKLRDEEGYPSSNIYDYDHSVDYVGPSMYTEVYDPETNRFVFQTDVAPEEYPDLTIEEEYNNYKSAIEGVLHALKYETEDEVNSDGYYKNKHSFTYKGESYPIYTKTNFTEYTESVDDISMFGDEPGSPLFIRLENKTTETTYLDLSFDSRFTSIGDNVYEFTVKANDSTGVTIDIPVGYTYEIEEVEDSDYTLKSINDDDVFDVKGEMGTGAETFTFFNESKDEPTPVEPTPRVDKPKYNLPKTGIE